MDNIVNGTRGQDKRLMSMITNAFTNLVATDQYVNETIKVCLYMGCDEKRNPVVSVSGQVGLKLVFSVIETS